MKRVAVFGSTGSIGESVLDIIRNNPDKFKLCAITANKNIQKLAEQSLEFAVDDIAIVSSDEHDIMRNLTCNGINIHVGDTGIADIAKMGYDIAVLAISGSCAIKPLKHLIGSTKIIGLANKESVVCAGALLKSKAQENDVKIIPIDSEHSAIFQIFENSNFDLINKVTLTASGGPFYNKSLDYIKSATLEQAISHPIWKMGAKISVDSATMMNKGLELIEAKYLFSLKYDQLDVLVHPQALVHSFVQYMDGALLAQLAVPDMKTPISFALGYPKRMQIAYKQIQPEDLSRMEFYRPDLKKFPLLELAFEVIKRSQEDCIILNTLNELAVEEFLHKKINFVQIAERVKSCIEKIKIGTVYSFDDVLSAIDEIKIRYNEVLYNV